MSKAQQQEQPWGRAKSRREMLDQPIRQPKTTWRGENVRGHKLTTEDVQVMRELWALGVPVSVIKVAFNVCGRHVLNVLTRRKWAHVPATDRERTALGCQVETNAPPLATTGRIQQWVDNRWTTYPDVRRAEIASGLDRLVIAEACLSGGAGWRYEPGIGEDVTPDLW